MEKQDVNFLLYVIYIYIEYICYIYIMKAEKHFQEHKENSKERRRHILKGYNNICM